MKNCFNFTWIYPNSNKTCRSDDKKTPKKQKQTKKTTRKQWIKVMSRPVLYRYLLRHSGLYCSVLHRFYLRFELTLAFIWAWSRLQVSLNPGLIFEKLPFHSASLESVSGSAIAYFVYLSWARKNLLKSVSSLLFQLGIKCEHFLPVNGELSLIYHTTFTDFSMQFLRKLYFYSVSHCSLYVNAQFSSVCWCRIIVDSPGNNLRSILNV